MKQIFAMTAAMGIAMLTTACNKAATPAQAQGQMQAMPVKVLPVALSPVASADTYVATVKSRRSATLQAQVDGNITQILVHSGDHVRQGQTLMEIDPRKQVATVQSQKATEQQTLATFQFNQVEVARQQKLYEAGVTSRDTYDQAEQAYKNSKAAYDAAAAATKSQEEQLKYYHITAPFAGVVGDIPVHVGDYVSPASVTYPTLTTVDDTGGLEVYIYVPTERASQVKRGLPVAIVNEDGSVVEQTSITFLSPQVDNGLQGILVKAPVHSAQMMTLRNAQSVKARITWGTANAPVVPVLAVSRIGGQSFVFVAQAAGKGYIAHQTAVQLGETIGNMYPVIQGLKEGDRVIISGTQILAEGFPVQPLG